MFIDVGSGLTTNNPIDDLKQEIFAGKFFQDESRSQRSFPLVFGHQS